MYVTYIIPVTRIYWLVIHFEHVVCNAEIVVPQTKTIDFSKTACAKTLAKTCKIDITWPINCFGFYTVKGKYEITKDDKNYATGKEYANSTSHYWSSS